MLPTGLTDFWTSISYARSYRARWRTSRTARYCDHATVLAPPSRELAGPLALPMVARLRRCGDITRARCTRFQRRPPALRAIGTATTTVTAPPKNPGPSGRPKPDRVPTLRPPTPTVLLARTARWAGFRKWMNQGVVHTAMLSALSHSVRRRQDRMVPGVIDVSSRFMLLLPTFRLPCGCSRCGSERRRRQSCDGVRVSGVVGGCGAIYLARFVI